jgi:hypothetical protein
LSAWNEGANRRERERESGKREREGEGERGREKEGEASILRSHKFFKLRSSIESSEKNGPKISEVKI